MTFSEDIKSKHLSNYVLVTIGDIDEPTHRISTNKVRLGEDYYKPILLNIPSISESLDVENRKYKISSVRLSISDYEEDGVRFSDSLNTLMNNEVNIYYASQSCQTLDDCYLAGTYIVRSFTQDENNVNLTCEDLSQDKLHKDLPLEYATDNIIVSGKERKPQLIPMVFGFVENSPSIYKKTTGEEISALVGNGIGGNYEILFDVDDNTPVFEEFYNPLRLYDKNIKEYLKVYENQQENLLDTDADGNIKVESNHNIYSVYEIIENKAYIKSQIENKKNLAGYYNRNLPYDDLVQCNLDALPKEIHITDKDEFDYSTQIENNLDGTFYFHGQLHYNFNFDNSNYDQLNVKILYPTPSYDSPAIVIQGYLKITGAFDTNAVAGQVLQTEISFGNTSDGLTTYNISSAESLSSVSLSDEAVFVTSNTNKEVIDSLSYMMQTTPIIGNGSVFVNAGTDSNALIPISFQFWFNKRIENEIFYASVRGRESSNPTLQNIYSHILGENVLDSDVYNSDLASNFSLGNYGFTVDKTISSKKLMEELSESSGLFPYFKNGEFNVKAIKSDYASNDKGTLIKTEDVLSYKYDRTKIEKVYSKVNVKYYYDYGLKDYTKETGFIQEGDLDGIASDYDPLYFGDDFDQELVFESKYIREEETALSLAKYLFGTYCNQHNLITVKLGLQYLELELGQIVHFDGLIQGRKIFGEDYNYHYERNGQLIHPFFFITQIKKNLETVELKLYQLHYFSFNTSFRLGCTDDSALEDSIDDQATHNDGSCLYDEIIIGCMANNALNYNPDAKAEGVCVFQDEGLQRTEITSHENDFVLPLPEEVDIIGEVEVPVYEEGATIITGNYIATPELNSHFTNFFNNNFQSISEFGNIYYGGNSQIGELNWKTTSQASVYSEHNEIEPNALTITCSSSGNLFGIVMDGGDGTLGNFTGVDVDGNTIAESTPLGIGDFRITFRAKKYNDPNIQNTANYIFIRIYSSSQDSDTYQLYDEWTDYEIDMSVIDYPTHNKVIILACEDENEGVTNMQESSSFVIDDFQIFGLGIGDIQVGETFVEGVVGTEIIDSVLNLTFTQSSNLLEPISDLISYTPSGQYAITIVQYNGNPDPQFSYDLIRETEFIPAIHGQDEYQVQINFSELLNCPQHTGLELWIQTQSHSVYPNGGDIVLDNVFNPNNIREAMPFSWGEIEEENTSVIGDINADNVLSISDVVLMVNIVLGVINEENQADMLAGLGMTWEEYLLQGDTNGDGNITIADIVFSVNVILNP